MRIVAGLAAGERYRVDRVTRYCLQIATMQRLCAFEVWCGILACWGHAGVLLSGLSPFSGSSSTVECLSRLCRRCCAG
jgi:hypothetical protein